MKYELVALISFVASLFVLYRLLIRNYEKQIHILKDELEYKKNYKYKLEEFKAFYEEELEILNRKLSSRIEERENLEKEKQDAKERINEIDKLLSQESAKRSKVEEIIERVHKKYKLKINSLKEDNSRLIKSLETSGEEYKGLVTYIKNKYGSDAVSEYHYGEDTTTQLKNRLSRSKAGKYKGNRAE